jgi:hypothetical protein
MGPGWPNVDEEQLTAAAASYQRLAAKISGTVVPQQSAQLSKLGEVWQGSGAVAASGEATTMIGGHEANAAQAEAIATQLLAMAAAVVQTKTAVNATAQGVQHAVEMLLAAPMMGDKQALVQGLVREGMSQNIATVTAATSELATSLGTTANMPQMTTPPTARAQQAGQQGMQQMMQMMGQLPQILGQIPQMLGQIPQQLTQPLQQLTQPLTSMFGSAGKGGSGGGPSPFSAFSTHPAAGGSGPSSGSGLVKAASLPGAGGGSPQTPVLAKLVGGTSPVSVDAATASSNAVGGVAPVAAGGGMSPGMMGQRGTSGGTASGLGVPAPLEHDVDFDEDDDDGW